MMRRNVAGIVEQDVQTAELLDCRVHRGPRAVLFRQIHRNRIGPAAQSLHRAPVPIVGDVPAIRPSKAQRRRLSPAERQAVDAAADEDAG